MENSKTCGLNYEAEYNRLLDENKALRERMLDAERKAKETGRDVEILRAQMEVVHLIFGRNY